ncbi:hypothetical protein F5I97DRAFT_1857250 [Phlebopus sp. FC_14]|nr:hypothetical protein F5I97DRAFT_1857250 [Phlebopus sp. FC_14]
MEAADAFLQTVSAIYSFFLAIMIYSEVQKCAQAELDAVVGIERLPMFEDRDVLSCIDAICKEVM